jgi:hypothetical protein
MPLPPFHLRHADAFCITAADIRCHYVSLAIADAAAVFFHFRRSLAAFAIMPAIDAAADAFIFASPVFLHCRH